MMSSIIEWIYGLFQVVANSILPDKICGVTPGHYAVIFYASVAIVIFILIVGIGSMMALEDLDFVTAFYFSTQTSVVRMYACINLLSQICSACVYICTA